MAKYSRHGHSVGRRQLHEIGVGPVPAQPEMVEDQYPLVLINGSELARELRSMARDGRGGDLAACIDHVLAQREAAVTNRRPEEISLE
ncbi:hypothetical protein NJO91_36240 [Streptomyces microflavus]|uniref:hypothetical protein n=1 Tax=Streptomyces microflavus TaxID=1919 RepID=UPI0029B6D726|nr:hypothetical protein [Streptomyces microflavus]MDX2408552.1 hypothetical protein [Streptomyces microflavus]